MAGIMAAVAYDDYETFLTVAADGVGGFIIARVWFYSKLRPTPQVKGVEQRVGKHLAVTFWKGDGSRAASCHVS